ncbi:MAG: hypothetical protein LKI24_14190 [Acidipropionibacterium sp.]|nr:hypothetical protein [Acidipropionibacterium sp.]
MKAVINFGDPVVFETRSGAEQWVATTLGEFAGDFDITAICSAVFEWDSRAAGVRLAVTEEQYWQIVQQHEVGPR